LAQTYLKDSFFLKNNWPLIFFISTLTCLYLTGRLNFLQLGLSNPNSWNIRLGLLVGIIPIVAVLILDLLLLKTGIAEKDLFLGAELRESPNFSIISLLLNVFIAPAINQIFITGYMLNILAKKNVLAISANGIIYATMSFNWEIGYLGLGMISAVLLRFSGSLIPSIFFAIGCSTGKFLILTSYPRITTLLAFLV
jgi:membrane protease YdiL (CAAX protease family)